MRVAFEAFALPGRERPPEVRFQALGKSSAQNFPKNRAAQREHAHRVAARHRGRGLLERHDVARPAVSVHQQYVAKTVASQRRAVIHRKVAHRPSPRQERPWLIKRRRPERDRRAEQHRPAGLFRDDPIGQSLAEKLRVEHVRSHRQMGPVLFEGAYGKHHRRALAVKLAQPGEGKLGESKDTSLALPRLRGGWRNFSAGIEHGWNGILEPARDCRFSERRPAPPQKRLEPG